MACVRIVDIAVACVLDNVALVVRDTSRPVATVVTDHLACGRVAVGIKGQRLVGPYSCPGQGHVHSGWVCLWRLQSPDQAFRILLRKDGLLIQLIIERVGKEVAAGCEVSCPRDGAVADNGVLGRAHWSQRQAGRCDGHRACAVGVDRHCVVGGQRQQRVILVHGNVSVGQDLKGERIGASTTSAAGCVDCSAGDIADWDGHDSILAYGNCTILPAVCLLDHLVAAHCRSQVWELNNACFVRLSVRIARHSCFGQLSVITDKAVD